MRRALAVLGLALAMALGSGHWQLSGAAGDSRMAVAPLKRSVRAGAAAAAVQEALHARLGEAGEVIAEADTRVALRRLRLRDVDTGSRDALSRLAEELEYDWLVVGTVHDARTAPVPDLSVSVRVYGASGDLAWSGFEGRSAIDGETILGLGVADSIDDLAPVVVDRLLAASPVGKSAREDARRPRVSSGVELGKVALLPLTGYVADDALVAADAATEAARAVLYAAKISLAPPACVHHSMRRQGARQWGELPVEARAAIRADCGVDRILTGSIEHWSIGGTGLVPKPEASVSLRLLDAESGRILWMGAKEGTGWDGFGLFRGGWVYSRGQLLVELLTDLTGRLMRSAVRPRTGMQPEESPE